MGSDTSGERGCDKEHKSVLDGNFATLDSPDVGVLRSPEVGLVMRLQE